MQKQMQKHVQKPMQKLMQTFFLHENVISLITNLLRRQILHETLIRHFGGLSQFHAKKYFA